MKRRLIEYLAVRKLNPTGRGAILCFVGPPGVGKTQSGQTVADALGRKFARILGGMRDEAEIRGHRRTYVGAMPGRIIQSLRRVESRNPVILLDELDKVGADFRGDPASALLEVLDPRRTTPSPTIISTCRSTCRGCFSSPPPTGWSRFIPPLRDRLEVIELPGYTEQKSSRSPNAISYHASSRNTA